MITLKIDPNFQLMNPTHYNQNTKKYYHVISEPKYKNGMYGGHIVVDALTCGGIWHEQKKVTVDYNPLKKVEVK